MPLPKTQGAAQPGSLTAAMELLRDMLLYRLEMHFKGVQVSLDSFKGDERWTAAEACLQVPDALTQAEMTVLLLALAPRLQPGFYEDVMRAAMPEGGEFPEFGGVKGQQHRAMLPTGETALFLLAGMDIEQRLEVQRLFSEDGACSRLGLLHLEYLSEGEPAMSGRLQPDEDWLEKILIGQDASPVYSSEFPARRITTLMDWEDLVLHPRTMEQVLDIRLWMEYNARVLEDAVLQRKITPGYRVLFYGPSGTGKTFTATLLGKHFDLPVYRIDLSQVVSKYIGETEKHIEWVFSRAARKGWILFFDEADALFGKRTSVQSAHDKYANQEVAYLLQRIEEYDGLLILASNYKNNIDDAFLRRFQTIIHFPMPKAAERQKLWEGTVPASLPPEEALDWKQIAVEHEITGAGIVNVMHYAALRAFAREDDCLRRHDVIEGLRREFRKEEKTM
ncbi:ATP-binding protein [bacterium]|nr:ATP-binding protein [bacterium]